MIGGFESSHTLRNRSCEGAPFVAEQFTLEQTKRNRCAVHANESVPATRSLGVYHPRNEFLSGTALALDENCGIGARNHIHLLKHASQRLTVTHQLAVGRLFDAPPADLVSFNRMPRSL